MRPTRWLLFLVPGALVASLAAAAIQLSPDAQRGREIYRRGLAPGGQEAEAVIAGSATRMPASAMPCVNCHGPDGNSALQGSLAPAPISWPALTSPREGTKRSRPAYDEARLRRSITMGFDAAGNALDKTMPRYLFTREDVDDLVEYLKTLGTLQDPGISDEALQLATLLPSQGRLGEQGRAVEAALRAGIEAVNQSGGVAGRVLRLRVVEAPLDPAARLEVMRSLLEESSVFALISPFFIGAEEAMTGLAEEFTTPVIAPMTLRPQLDDPINPYVFYLYSGLQDQCRALLRYAARGTDSARPVVSMAVSSDGRFDRVAQAIEAEAAALGWRSPRRAICPPEGCNPDWLEAFRNARSDIFFVLLPPAQVTPTLEKAEERQFRPRVFMPSLVFSAEVFAAPPSFAGRIFISYPTLPGDLPAVGREKLRQLELGSDSSEDYDLLQANVLAAAGILREALTRSGRDLSNRALVLNLQSLDSYATGLTRPLTYSPVRRTGILGAHVVPVELSARRILIPGEWVDLDSD